LAYELFPDIFPEMDARTKAVKTHRKRLRTRGLKRVEVTVLAEHVMLVRDFAAQLRENPARAKEITAAVRAEEKKRSKNLAEALYDPAVAGPDFDDVFEEIERSRHDPEMMKTRDIEL
jgi:hypothetical protein